tara:strand:- start:566 stop:844 length:279 start_codon:yes stop_codon:yes gene_type:complete
MFFVNNFVTYYMEKVAILLLLAVFFKANVEVSEDSNPLGEITAVNDGRLHQYISVKEGENWCWYHNEWENVRIVHSARRKEEEPDSLKAESL